MRRFDRLTEDVLPRLASEGEGWPVQFDHCFRRICLDCAVGRPWDQSIEPPARNHMTEAQAREALRIAQRCVVGGPAYTSRRDEQSLLLRGEVDPGDCEWW